MIFYIFMIQKIIPQRYKKEMKDDNEMKYF